ncbi:MAG TPA: hypothetical protein VKV20_06135 [Ktedonobacteraceae bacterium]|jgi:hypothetical protein|nr:hypothetical protein [Ktedonobacteraceae bacterium]
MLHKVSQFLQALFRDEQTIPFSSSEQAAPQATRERDTGKQYVSSAIKKEFVERDTLPLMPAIVRERTTEPYPSLIRKKNPALRYRNLDAMLEQLKRERLHNMNTQLVPRVAYKPVRRLQRIRNGQEES